MTSELYKWTQNLESDKRVYSETLSFLRQETDKECRMRYLAILACGRKLIATDLRMVRFEASLIHLCPCVTPDCSCTPVF